MESALDSATLSAVEAFNATHDDDDARARPRSLREWLKNPQLLIEPVPSVPFLAWPGRVTLLSARAKAGKSTISGQAAAAKSTGASFLGEPTEPATVLWYAIDEPVADIVRRLHGHGADLDRCFIKDTRPTAPEMEADVTETRAHFVVIDTLTELWAGRIENDRDANQVACFVRPYVEAARITKAALALLHHTTKNGVEFRGSEQLAAAVDVVLTLRQPTPKPASPDEHGAELLEGDGFTLADDGRRRLEGKGRGNIRVDVRLHFDGTLYRLGDGSLSLEFQILRAIQLEPMSATALAKVLKVRKETMLSKTHDMADRGLLGADGSPAKLFLTNEGLDAFQKQAHPVTGGTDPGTGPGTGHASILPADGPAGTGTEPSRNQAGTTAGTAAGSAVPEDISYAVEPGTAPAAPYWLHFPGNVAGEAA